MQEFRCRVPQFRYRVRRRDVLQKEDASPRRKETRPHEGKESAYNAVLLGEKDGEDALRRPESTAEGGASGGGGAAGPRVALEATLPPREQHRLTILREGEVRVPVGIAHTPEDVGHGP